MKTTKIIRYIWIGLIISVSGFLLFLIVRFVVDTAISLKAYSDRIQESYNYSEKTEPLSRETINHLCTSFELSTTDSRCKPDSIVYGPDFFPEITALLNDSPKKTISRQDIESKIGQYLIRCGTVDKEGDYRCRYDLKGDGMYPIYIYYSDNDLAYRIIANIGGS